MDSKQIRKSFKKHSQFARVYRLIAKFVDVFLALLVGVLFYPGGILVSVIYLSIADSLMHGESIGKRLLGLKVIDLKEGKPCTPKASMIRNLPLTIPIAFFIFPIVGLFIGVILLVPFVAFEIYLIMKLDSFHRLGDIMANTTVIANDPHREDLQKKVQGWFQSPEAPATLKSHEN